MNYWQFPPVFLRYGDGGREPTSSIPCSVDVPTPEQCHYSLQVPHSGNGCFSQFSTFVMLAVCSFLEPDARVTSPCVCPSRGIASRIIDRRIDVPGHTLRPFGDLSLQPMEVPPQVLIGHAVSVKQTRSHHSWAMASVSLSLYIDDKNTKLVIYQ